MQARPLMGIQAERAKAGFERSRIKVNQSAILDRAHMDATPGPIREKLVSLQTDQAKSSPPQTDAVVPYFSKALITLAPVRQRWTSSGPSTRR